MGPPGGARNPVDPRFISLFNVFEIQFPSTDNLRTIYQVRENCVRGWLYMSVRVCAQRKAHEIVLLACEHM